MTHLQFKKILREVYDLPDKFLVRLIRLAADEILKRTQQNLKTLYDKRRNH